MTTIFKILTEEEWKDFQEKKEFIGSAFDLNDGFIHCSYENQVQNTLDLFFKEATNLFLAEIDPKDLNVKVENGFPHVYEKISIEKVLNTKKVK